MGKLFCIMGKSASGKDTVYKALVNDPELHLHTVVPYTTRPIREGEAEGENYYFVDESVFCRMAAEGKIIEDRAYNTVDGLWRYFTADDGQNIGSLCKNGRIFWQRVGHSDLYRS